MSTDPHLTRRAWLGLLAAGGPAGLGGCLGDGEENGTAEPSPTATDGVATQTPSNGSGPGSAEDRIVRLSPVGDPREVWRTGLVTVYPTDLVGWLREVATHDRTLRKRVSTSREMPDPPLQVLKHVRFVTLEDAPFLADSGEVTGHYDLNVKAGPRYEMAVGAEAADPPADATVTAVADLAGERRDLAVAAITEDADETRVSSDTALGQWVQESFIDGYYRYDGDTYRGHEQQTDAGGSTTEAWYELSATQSREGDDDTYVLLSDLEGTVRTELADSGVGEGTDELVVEDPSAPLAAFADRMAMLVTHVAIFRVDLETA